MVKRSKILACLMASVLLLGNTLPVFAQDIELSGDSATGSTPSSFTVDADYLGGGVVVVIPATLDLTVDDDTGGYTANDVVSAKGNMNPSKVLKVSTDTEIEYVNTDDNAVTATGTVTFGTDGTEQWTAAQTKASLTSLDSRAIDVAVAKDSLPYTGEYTSIVYFNIEAADADNGGIATASLFTWSTDGASATVTGLADDVTETNVAIPATYNGLPVTAIGQGAFFENVYATTVITNVTIPNSVTTIGQSAFKWSGLTSIDIPNGVETIEPFAFMESESLVTVTMADSVTSVGNAVFSGCTALENVTLSNGLTAISGAMFSQCANLESITIPANVTSIGGHAFNGCTNLATVTYNGVGYTTVADFTSAFEAAGGTVDASAFTDAGLSQ